MRFVIVTGMSGAGKSTALKMLEDAEYFCVDNLPIPLVEKFAQLTGRRYFRRNPESGSWNRYPKRPGASGPAECSRVDEQSDRICYEILVSGTHPMTCW